MRRRGDSDPVGTNRNAAVAVTYEELWPIGLVAPGLVAILGWRKIRQIETEVDRARVRNDDGSLRDLSPAERVALAEKMDAERGKYFWHLIVGGILLAGGMLLVLWIVGVLSAE